MQTPYEVLGLPSNAYIDEIENRWDQLIAEGKHTDPLIQRAYKEVKALYRDTWNEYYQQRLERETDEMPDTWKRHRQLDADILEKVILIYQEHLKATRDPKHNSDAFWAETKKWSRLDEKKAFFTVEWGYSGMNHRRCRYLHDKIAELTIAFRDQCRVLKQQPAIIAPLQDSIAGRAGSAMVEPEGGFNFGPPPALNDDEMADDGDDGQKDAVILKLQEELRLAESKAIEFEATVEEMKAKALEMEVRMEEMKAKVLQTEARAAADAQKMKELTETLGKNEMNFAAAKDKGTFQQGNDADQTSAFKDSIANFIQNHVKAVNESKTIITTNEIKVSFLMHGYHYAGNNDSFAKEVAVQIANQLPGAKHARNSKCRGYIGIELF